MVISLHDGMSGVRGQGGGCYARSATLAELARTDISNFSKAVSRLLALGYISRERQQSDTRRFTLRVIFTAEDSWPVDQQSIPTVAAEPSETVGELTNNPPETDGESTNKIVGEASAENGGKPSKTAPHYILRSRELDFEESKELDSAKLRDARCASRPQDRIPSNGASSLLKKDPAEAGLGRTEPVSIAALLPQGYREMESQALLSCFERVFKEIGRDPSIIEPNERAEFEGLIFAIADVHCGKPVGRRAQRLLDEMDLAA